MEIKKRLRIGSPEVNAVLLYDEGEEYPVFLESLHNTVIFPTLLDSGYKIVAMPYEFVKDNVSFSDLPVEDYMATPEEQETMAYSIGTKLSYAEISSHIKIEEAVGIPTPPTNYTIMTREEFLEYLDSLQVVNSEEDFKPINYFVSPAARFSISEYLSDEYSKYINIITDRRTMSLSKFRKLVNWLGQFGLSPAAKPLDIVDAYFAWGYDGINLPIFDKHREQRIETITPFNNSKEAVLSYKYTVGLVDRNGSILTSPNEADMQWHPVWDRDKYDLFLQSIPEGEVRDVSLEARTKEEVVVCNCANNMTMTYSADKFKLSRWLYPTLRINALVGRNNFLPISLSTPAAEGLLLEECILRALAKELYYKRRNDIKVSSYDALLNSGCNPYTAISYIGKTIGLWKDGAFPSEYVEDGDSQPELSYEILRAFFEQNNLNDRDYNCIIDIINGVTNIDKVDDGMQADNSSGGYEQSYKLLKAVHNIFGVSLDQIYKDIQDIKDDQEFLEYSYKGVKLVIPVSKFTGAVTGYDQDLKDYALKRAQQCGWFMYVKRVACEVGVEECIDRHVGIEFYMVNAYKPKAAQALNDLVNIYNDRVNSAIANPIVREKFFRLARNWAMRAFFEVVAKGTYTLPKQLGGGTSSANPDLVKDCKASVETKIESLTTLCNHLTLFGSGANYANMDGHCTNAILTPTRVIPREGNEIPCNPFYTLWVDWRRKDPVLNARLIDSGIIPENFVAWECRYLDQMFVQRSEMELDNNDTLLYYYDNAVEEVDSVPNDVEFKTATHPIDYMYPAINKLKDEEEAVKLPVPREGAPLVRVGIIKTLKHDELEPLRHPKEKLHFSDQYIREFDGFSVEELIHVPDIFSKIPSGFSDLLVVKNYIYDLSTNVGYDFRRIAELIQLGKPIVHTYDRRYLFASSDGKVWEVQV